MSLPTMNLPAMLFDLPRLNKSIYQLYIAGERIDRFTFSQGNYAEGKLKLDLLWI